MFRADDAFHYLINKETEQNMKELFSIMYDASEAMHGLQSLAKIQLGEVNYKRVEVEYELEDLKKQIRMIQERIKFEGAETVLWNHVELEEKKIGKKISNTDAFFALMGAISVVNGSRFSPKMSRGDSKVVAEYIEWKGRIFFLSDEIYPAPYITDATFAFAIKVGVLVELNKKYTETVKSLFKNPTPYLKKMAEYMEANPAWHHKHQDIVNYVLA